MSRNKKVKEQMVRIFGKECFIEKLRLRDTSGLTYKSKGQYKRMKSLTYHHIRMKSKGGKATIENGAILSVENHQWFHKQPTEEQERMNRMFQQYKQNIENGNIQECQVVIVPDNSTNIDVRVATFKPSEFNRAEEKRKTKELIEKYFKGEEK